MYIGQEKQCVHNGCAQLSDNSLNVEALMDDQLTKVTAAVGSHRTVQWQAQATKSEDAHEGGGSGRAPLRPQDNVQSIQCTIHTRGGLRSARSAEAPSGGMR